MLSRCVRHPALPRAGLRAMCAAGGVPSSPAQQRTSSWFLAEASQVLQERGAPSDEQSLHRLAPFHLERYLAVHEFQVQYQLSCSDASAWKQSEILALADSECRALWDDLSLQYTESLGHPLLLEEVYRKYEKKVCQNQSSSSAPESYFDPGQHAVRIVECIPAEGILMAMLAFAMPGDRVVVQSPHYQGLGELPRSRGCEVQSWDPVWDADAHSWRFDLHSLESMLLADSSAGGGPVKMLVLNSPHNPTGYFFTQSEVGEISRLCQRHHTILFVDEMYADILHHGPDSASGRAESSPVSPAVSAVGLPNSVVLSGLSKPAGLPGLRTGWLVVENKMHFAELCQVRDYTTICPTAPAEILSIIALRNEQALLRRSREVCRQNLAALQGMVSRLPDVFEPLEVRQESGLTGAMTVLVRLNGNSDLLRQQLQVGSGSPNVADALCSHLLDQYALCAVPSSLFAVEQPAIRFGLGRCDFMESLRILEAACRALLDR